MDEVVTDMEAANAVGDTRKVFKMVKHLSKSAKPPPKNLTSDANGSLLKSPEEVARIWSELLREKFAATDREVNVRGPLPPLPSIRQSSDALTRAEFEKALNIMKNGKATGPDGVPAEVYKYCDVAKEELFKFLNQVWEQEQLPEDFAQAKFVMLFKSKGSSNDPSKYRCIGLLNHSYKVLSLIMLMRLLNCSDNFLHDWQNGFRRHRGCRDNTFILRTMCHQMMMLGEKIALTFVDYSAAFDSVSHKFLDEALAEANAPIKVRAMFRAVYAAASAHTTVPAPDGKTVKSEIFPIRRGVVQGDC